MKHNFKKLSIFLLAGLLSSGIAMAQAPQKFNYQGIARDLKGNPMGKQTLGLKISVLPTADATVAEYEETQTITTNDFGLYTLQIGAGKIVSGEMKTVTWETGNKYIKVAIDAKGGTDYVDAGTTQLLSVPYAIYADKAGTANNANTKETRAGAVSTSAAGTGTTNFITKFTAANTIYNSQLFDNGTNIGLGTTSPQAKMHMNTAGGNNELRIQSNGGSPRLSFFGDAETSFTSTANYALMYKRPATDVGNFSTGFPNSKLFIFGNAQGSLLFNTGGNVGFGYFNQAANTTTTNLFVEGTTGKTGIGTATPGSHKLKVMGGSFSVSNTADTRGMVYNPDITNDLYFNGGNANITTGTFNSSINLQQFPDTKVGVGVASPNAKLDVRGEGINGVNSRGSFFGVQGVCDSNGVVPLIPIPSAGVYGSSNGNSLTNGVYGTMYNTGCSNCNAISGVATNGNVGVKAIGTGTGTIALDVAGPLRVSGTTSNRFAQTITQPSNSSYVDVPSTISNSASDILMVTSVWQAQYISSAIQIWWTGTKWQIFRGDLGTINAGEKFNVIAIKN